MATPTHHLNIHISTSSLLKGLNPPVTIASFLIIVSVVIYTLLYQEATAELFDRIRSGITYYFSWYYVLLAALFLFFNAWLALSRFGSLRLGGDDEKPEFSYFAWFAMLYAAGQGIGLIFWSIAEPILHLQSNPFTPEGMTPAAATAAMRISFFHWGLHAWSIYCIVALCLAYAAYRRGLPLTIRSTLQPLLGDRVNGALGHAADILAILATIFGVATSLGLGAQQINAGLNHLFGWEISVATQLGLIAIITTVAVISAVSGVARGIRLLSELNLWLTVILLVFFFAWGPTRYLIMLLVEATGDYLATFISLSFWVDVSHYNPAAVWEGWKSSWQGWWTIFYWGWWMSWAPFVGVFIARVSRGRTIREFITGVILVSSLLTFVWLAAYGGTALSVELFGGGGIAQAVSQNVATALYATIGSMEAGLIGLLAALVGTVLVATYFITSSDSATLVLTTIMSHGDAHPPRRHRIFWGIKEGLVAAVLLVAGGAGALTTLQTASITAGLPFSLIMILMCYSLVKALRHEEANTSNV